VSPKAEHDCRSGTSATQAPSGSDRNILALLSVLDRQAEFPNHIEELRDLERLGFPVWG
jgi:hypothetical protein